VSIARRLLIAATALVLLAIAFTLRRDVHGWTLVTRAANQDGVLRTLAEIDTVPIRERIIAIPLPRLQLRARVYEPLASARQTVLLVSGLHPAGIDEPRLVDLARKLAQADVVVVTPAIPELSRFAVTEIVTDRIEQSASWLAATSGLAPSGRIGLIGVSFSGGLAIVAAGRDSLRHRLRYVLSFAGHDDLLRVVDYFCTGVDSAVWPHKGLPPHDYGVAVALLNVAPSLVPSEQVAGFEHTLREFLRASYVDTVDKAAAMAAFDALRLRVRGMPEPSATLLRYVNDRDVDRLGPLLLPYVGAYAEAPGLSPARSPLPSVPVFLIHGRHDTVIPSSEAERLADRLRGRVRTRLLISELISHADADQPVDAIGVWQLAHFWGDVLSQ
jgi:fermentation-respiration switch protein FrsA (DUF1100 family)